MATDEIVYEGPGGQATTREILDTEDIWYDPDIDYWVIAREWADRGGNTPVTYVPTSRILSVSVTYNIMEGDRVPSPPEELTSSPP